MSSVRTSNVNIKANTTALYAVTLSHVSNNFYLPSQGINIVYSGGGFFTSGPAYYQAALKRQYDLGVTTSPGRYMISISPDVPNGHIEVYGQWISKTEQPYTYLYNYLVIPDSFFVKTPSNTVSTHTFYGGAVNKDGTIAITGGLSSTPAGKLYVSADGGNTFTERVVSPFTTFSGRSLTFGKTPNDIIVSVEDTLNSNNRIFYSNDLGLTFVQSTNPTAVTVRINALASDALAAQPTGKVVAVHQTGAVTYSADNGKTFSSTVSVSAKSKFDVMYFTGNDYNPPKFIAVGDGTWTIDAYGYYAGNGQIIESENGINWSVAPLTMYYSNNFVLNSIAYNYSYGNYLAVGTNGIVLAGFDTYAMGDYYEPLFDYGANAATVSCSDGIFYVVPNKANNNLVYASDSGFQGTWKPVSANTHYAKKIFSGNNRFVIVGANNTVTISNTTVKVPYYANNVTTQTIYPADASFSNAFVYMKY